MVNVTWLEQWEPVYAQTDQWEKYKPGDIVETPGGGYAVRNNQSTAYAPFGPSVNYSIGNPVGNPGSGTLYKSTDHWDWYKGGSPSKSSGGGGGGGGGGGNPLGAKSVDDAIAKLMAQGWTRGAAQSAVNKWLQEHGYSTGGSSSSGGSSHSGGSSSSGGGSSGSYSEQIWRDYATYEPKRAQLAYELAQKYMPLQQQLELEMAQRFQPQYQTLQEQLRSSDRAADISDVLALAPQLQRVREASEMPETTAMRKALMGQVNDELAMGTQMTPDQARQAEQALRTAQIARGTNAGRGGSAREAVTMALQGQALQTQRQQKAQSVLNQEYAASPEPFAAILGRNATAQNLGYGQYSSGMNMPELAGQSVNGVAAGFTAQELANQLKAINNQYSLGMANVGLGQSQLALQNAMWQSQLKYLPLLINEYTSLSGISSGTGPLIV